MRRIGGGQTDDAPKSDGRLKAMLARRLTISTAALAGPVTHVPGIFYLAALSLIVAHNVAATGQIFALVVYDVIWFALPIAALVMCILAAPSRSELDRDQKIASSWLTFVSASSIE